MTWPYWWQELTLGTLTSFPSGKPGLAQKQKHKATYIYTQMRLVRVHLPLPSKNRRERRLCSGYFWKVWSVRRRMSNILAYLRVALAATDLQKLKYRQLMRSTCRIKTMVLLEQNQCHIHVTRKTVSGLARKQVLLIHLMSEGTKTNLNTELERQGSIKMMQET